MASAEGYEIERRYLLRHFPLDLTDPESPLSVEPIEIEQGWLPPLANGDRERLRRMRDTTGVEQFFLTVKRGSGVRRMELESVISPSDFESRWPLTAGCRIHKMRYRVRDGELVWEIDRFLDFELAMAEVEIPHEDTPIRFPEWLASHMEREVTEDPRYTNRALADAGGPPRAAT